MVKDQSSAFNFRFSAFQLFSLFPRLPPLPLLPQIGRVPRIDLRSNPEIYSPEMSLTVIREGTVLRIIDSTGEVPAGRELRLYTEEELPRHLGCSPLEHLQLESAFAENEEDWGNSLDALTLEGEPSV